MNSALMFSKASDEWETPQDFYDTLRAEFEFALDVAASAENTKCHWWLGPGSPYHHDALSCYGWGGICGFEAIWMNPPYSRCREFIARAAEERKGGSLVVALVPARTDTRWFHEHVWDAAKHRPRKGIEVRFIKGRLKFGDGKNSAPFPSMLVVFRP